MIDFESAPLPGCSPVGMSIEPVVSSTSYLDELNDRQREAVLATDGPLIVLAGAGSGKTKMLTSRIAYLIGTLGVPAHNVLAVTFTNKAAAEMRERVERTLDRVARQSGGGTFLGGAEIGTFHAVCVRLLRREMASTPFTKQFVIYDDSDQLSLIKGVLAKQNIDDKAFNPKSIQAAINRAKCDALDPHDIKPEPHNVFEKVFKRAYEQYQKDLFANNALDFGEIITMTYRVLRDHSEVRAKYQRRFRYIHVDEYQDTNRAQYLLLSLLASPVHGGHRNICVVGDEDQSIYKWRGADISNILDFEAEYQGAHVVKLEQNYRSTKTIIKAAGDVIRNNTTRKDKTLWTDNEQGLPIVRAQIPDERAEAELAVGEIKRLAANEGRVFGDFAIFYRTNAQSRQFEDVLRREKIPYQVLGGLRFYDRKEIKDALSFFKVILNPSDSVNLKRIINVPPRGIGKTTIEKVETIQEVAGSSYWDALERAASDASLTSAATARKLGALVQLIQRLQAEQPKLLLSELYHLLLDETGYVRELRKEGTEESLARVENLEELDNLLQEFEEDNFHGLAEGLSEDDRAVRKASLLAQFIEESSLVSDTDSLDGQASAVKMMTLHSSKGLEFPVVFLAGMEEGLFPSIREWADVSDEDIEEERRLCYVGMTRAREQLYLMSVVLRRFWGNVSYQEPSRFFAEMPADLIDFRDFSHRSFGAGSATAHTRRVMERSSDSGECSPVPTQTFSQAAQKELVGAGLQHPEYGRGCVIAVEGSGDDRRVTIEFKGRDRRKFVLRYVASFIEA